VLITEHAKLSFTVPAKSVRAEIWLVPDNRTHHINPTIPSKECRT